MSSGSEWAVNIQRDSYASYVGHYPLLAFFAVAENESIGREKYNMLQVSCCYSDVRKWMEEGFPELYEKHVCSWLQKMLVPCGLPPEREDD